VKIKGNEKYEFYSIQLLLIQPNPTQPNPSHVLENASDPTQPNPWNDPTHVHLWFILPENQGSLESNCKKGERKWTGGIDKTTDEKCSEKVKEKTAMEWKWIRRFANTYRLFGRLFVCVCVTMVCHHA